MRSPAAGPPSPCWPAGSTGPTRRRTATLLDYVADTGLVVSELPPGCAPTRIRFLTRNRLIAALSLGTVVVEAAVRSGALNTATWAGRLEPGADGRCPAR